MSASLVGSEMCIRDSPETAAVLAHADSRADPLAALARWGSLPRHHWVAVSYTHLTLPTICSV
eukprot:9815793-Alexandrium_andersonii.AAC.1